MSNTVQISDESDDKIEEMQDVADWDLSKRQVADRAIDRLYDDMVDN